MKLECDKLSRPTENKVSEPIDNDNSLVKPDTFISSFSVKYTYKL